MSSGLAIFLAVFGGLLITSAYLDRMAARTRVPGVLLVLVLGLLTDNNLSALPGESPPLLDLGRADQLAQVAVAVVLFHGGLTTNWQAMRSVVRPGLRLATVGSLLTALMLMLVILVLERVFPAPFSYGLPFALFVGAMVCSTDASAVMAVLRPLSGQLPQRLLDLIECESAFNDPMAVVLAGVALAMVMGTDADGITVMSVVVRQFFLGGLIGFMGGTFGAQLLERRSLKELKSGQAVICLAVLLVLLGGTTLLGGSGLLAAYIGGLVIGNHDQVERQELEDGHEVFMKLAELLLFLCMGLVVAPEAVLRMLPWIALLFVAMQIVRLLTVPPLLAGTGSGAEKLFVSFCGLRGAVPIALAIQAAAQAKGPEAWGHYMPPLALGVVLLGLLVQGFSLVPLAQRLGLASPDAA